MPSKLPSTPYSHEFNVCGLAYRFTVRKDQMVWFGLIGGATAKGTSYDPFDLFYDQPKFSDVDLVPNALPVLLQFKKVLMEYVWSHRPWQFGFTASTQRKVPVFRWVSKRLSIELPSYKCIEYPMGSFLFHKIG